VLPGGHQVIEAIEILKIAGSGQKVFPVIVSRPLFMAVRKTRIKFRKLIPVHL